MISARSYLYVPGDRPDRLAKAIDRAGDAVIADLEDAVAPDRKDQALASVIEWSRDLRAPPHAGNGPGNAPFRPQHENV